MLQQLKQKKESLSEQYRESEVGQPGLAVRQIRRDDIAVIEEIERNSFEFAWTIREFQQVLGTPSCDGAVAVLNGRIVAYIIIERGRGYVDILNLAVVEEFRRIGVGTALIEKTIETITPFAHSIDLTVRERNVEAQQFFRSQGFRATAILRNFYDNMPEDAYIMERKLDQTQFDRIPYSSGRNTIQITLHPTSREDKE